MSSVNLQGKAVNQECFSNHKDLSKEVKVEFDSYGVHLRCLGNNSSPRYMPLNRNPSNRESFFVGLHLILYANERGFERELYQAVEDCSESTV